jgi:predicted glutamine amidotransferase
MCGLVGMFGSMTTDGLANKKTFLLESMITNSLRGFESTGIALFMEKEEPELYKKAVNGMDFIQLNRTKHLVDQLNKGVGCLIHNRASTRGSVHDANAHPFTKGDITLAHNGTLVSYSSLSKNYKGTVDSEAICWAFNEQGSDIILPKLDGSYSLVWWDTKDNSLNFARNDGRPMYMIWSKDGSYMLYGSEYPMLCWLADRNNLHLADEVGTTQPMHHYKFTNSKALMEFTKTPFQKALPSYQHTVGRATTANRWTRQENTSTRSTGTGTNVVPMQDARMLKHFTKKIGLKKAEALIAKAALDNLRLDTPCLVVPKSWTPYPGSNPQNRGFITAEVMHNAGIHVIVHSHTEKEWNKLMKQDIQPKRFWCDIVGLSAQTAGGGRRSYVGIENREKNKGLASVLAHMKHKTTPILEGEVLDKQIEVVTDSVLGPGGVHVSMLRFHEITKNGCANCSSSVTPLDAEGMVWAGGVPPNFLCPDCAADTHIVEDLKAVFGSFN